MGGNVCNLLRVNELWRDGRVAECTGLLNRRTEIIRTAGSNPALSGISSFLAQKRGI